MKWFLLIAGDYHYPEAEVGDGDWIGCYTNLEEAENAVQQIEGKYRRYTYTVQGEDGQFDWYEIIDLRKWVEGE